MIKNIKNINSEEIIDKVAGNYKYQILIAILTFLIGTCADFA